MAECNDFDALVELQRVQVDSPVFSNAVPAQRGAGAPGELLPRDQVGVMLELGGDDDVTGPHGPVEPIVAQHIRHQVERLGGVLGEHQLIGIRTDERSDVRAALFIGIGSLFHQLMRTTVHPAVGRDQKLALGVEHLQRALRRGTGIQIRQLASPAHDAAQDREISPDRGQVWRGCAAHRDRHEVRLLQRASSPLG